MKKELFKYGIILLLIILFAAPGVAAYLFYRHPQWLGASKTNKGVLLNPPVALKLLPLQNKWHIIFWTPVNCDTLCLKELDTLARMRLALGRKLYQVDQWIILADAASLTQEMQSKIKELDFHVVQLSQIELKAQSALFSKKTVFLADPDNYLILSYPSLVNPEDVYHDLKLLLNTTEKNG